MAMAPSSGQQISLPHTPGYQFTTRAGFTESKNLHVIDASIMPSIPVANTNVPAITVAQRIASVRMEKEG